MRIVFRIGDREVSHWDEIRPAIAAAIRARSCTSKIRYSDEDKANAAAARMAAKKAERFESYGCGYCGGWHIGHAR